MGSNFSKENFVQRISFPRKNPLRKKRRYRKVLILGLDSAGKTSLLYKLKNKELTNLIPTIGYNHEEVEYKNTIFSFWDLGGQDRVRDLWGPYFYKIHGIVFVVDSQDHERIEDARDLLKEVIQTLQAVGSGKCVVLILSNKQDSPRGMNLEDLHLLLELNKIAGTNMHFNLIACSAKHGTGLEDALEWLRQETKKVLV